MVINYESSFIQSNEETAQGLFHDIEFLLSIIWREIIKVPIAYIALHTKSGLKHAMCTSVRNLQSIIQSISPSTRHAGLVQILLTSFWPCVA